MAVSFCPVASGSSGNSIFLSTGATKILIDAGLSGKRLESGLNSIGVDCNDIDAILITHEHSDHTQGAGILSRRFDIPIYATPGTWNAMNRLSMIGKIAPKNKMYIYEDESLILNDMRIHPFEIPHDAEQPVGYCVFAEDKKMTVATDIGYITDALKENISGSDILLLESNHDIDLLMNGRYPVQLKRRILSNYGHLSNVSAGRFLAEIMSGNLKHVFLGHLSEENNRPVLAYETVQNILTANKISVGTSVNLYLADRHKASRLVTI